MIVNNLAIELPDTVGDVEVLSSTLEAIGFNVKMKQNVNVKVMVYLMLPKPVTGLVLRNHLFHARLCNVNRARNVSPS